MLTLYLLARLIVGVIAGMLLTGYFILQAFLWAVGMLAEALVWLVERLRTKIETKTKTKTQDP